MSQIQKYNDYKSSGVEWLGDVPRHWEVKRLKNVCNINQNSLSEDTNKTFTFDYVDIGSVSFEEGIIKTESFNFKNAPSRARRIATKGDTIVSTVRTYLKAIDFIDETKTSYIFSTGFAVLNPTKIDARFLSLVAKSDFFTNQVDINSKGMSYPAINATDLSRLNIIIPPIEEQTAIAQYLDQKTTQLDTAIAQKQRMIELLKERRQILIHRAVTQGIGTHPNVVEVLNLDDVPTTTPSVKMKDSGVEWIGSVPEHWEVKCIKYCTKIFRGKFTHRPRNDERLYDGIYPFFQTGDVARAGKFLYDYRQTLNEKGLKVSTLIPKGTIVITIAANIGDISILGIDACFPDSIVGFEPVQLLDRDFLYNTLLVMKEQFMSSTIKNTQMNLNVDRIGVNQIPIPPKTEQIAICEFIETATQKIEKAIRLKESEITKLKEYKGSLINSVVTGKVRVV